MRIILICLSWALTFCEVKAQSEANQILWDSYGVPHIYSRTTAGMYYEFGWAQMHNHAHLLLRLYGQARGRAAEYWGANYLTSDKQVLLFRIPELANKQYAKQEPLFRECIDAFAKGINAYAAAHPKAISKEDSQVLPVRPEDVLSHAIRVVYLRFVAGEKLGMPSRRQQAGSNAIAIGPSRSVSRHAYLLANPHLPWADLFTFFEAHLHSPGFNAYGAAVVGFPVLSIAFNDHLGWTHTVNPIDACDRYELSLRDSGYVLDSTVQPFEKIRKMIKVRQSDGSLETQAVVFSYSRHGPVIGSQEDKAYAVRIAGMDNPDVLYEWHRMARAENRQQFETAVRMMQLPMFNIIYADQGGNISYLFDGNVPRRQEGDWLFWKGVIDGRYSRYIWHDMLPYDSLPKLLNPPTGFIQNANDPPWTCTYPPLIDPDKYPSYISSRGMAMRPQRAVKMILDDHAISLEKLAGYKQNTGVEAADRLLDDLLAGVDRYPDSIALLAAVVLRAWDRCVDAKSHGSVLFTRWFDKLPPDAYSRPWEPEHPTETPAGLKDAQEAVRLLSQATREIIHDYGRLDIAWGDVYRFRLGGLDLPANGGPDQYGIYRTIYFARDSDGKYKAVAGDSYVAITEFGPKVKARVLMSYGNASQPGSRHIGDQLPLLSGKKLRDAWLDKEDIKKHLEETEDF